MRRAVALAALVLAVAAVAVLLVGDLGPDGPSDAERDGAGAQAPPATASSPARLGDASAARAANASPNAAPGSAVPTGPRITGTVVDEAGAPVAGARVAAVPDTHTRTFAMDDEPAPDDLPGSRARTDAEGRFAVGVSPEAPFHVVFAVAEGLSMAVRSAVPPGGDVRIVLGRGRTLLGTVRDRAGAPIAGARVRMLSLADVAREEREARTAPDGTYRIDGLRRRPDGNAYAEWAWLDVSADGYAPAWIEAPLGSSRADAVTLDVVLSRGATLVGRVSDASTGKAVEGATVALVSSRGTIRFQRPHGGSYENPFAPRVLATTETGPEGGYRFDRVPSASPAPKRALLPRGPDRHLLVVAWRRGYAASSVPIDTPEDGAQVEAPVRLWGAATVTGRVVEASSKAPIAGAGVSAAVEVEGMRVFGSWIPPSFEDAPRASATTGPDGRFRIEGVRAAAEPLNVTVYAQRPDAGPRPQNASVTRSMRAGESVDVGDLALRTPDPPPTTTVVARTRSGAPVFGASVSGGGGWPRRTDAEGRATLIWAEGAGDRPASTVAVVVRAPGHAPTPATLHPPGSGRDVVEVVLAPARRLSGRVLLASGAAAAGVTVAAGDGTAPADRVFPARRAWFQNLSEIPTDRALPLVHRSGTTDEAGAFSLDDLPDGPYHVLATRVRTWPERDPARVVVSDVRSDATDVVLRFPPEAPSGEVRGVLSVPAGMPPLSGGIVALHRDGVSVASAYSEGAVPYPVAHRIEADGSFRLSGVPPGTYAVVAHGAGLRSLLRSGVEVRVDETTDLGTLALTRGAAIFGRVVAPPGTTLRRREVRFVGVGPEATRAYAADLRADGTFREEGFEPGTYAVVVEPDRMSGTSEPVLVPSRGERVSVGEDAAEVRFDVTWVAGGSIGADPHDLRFPPPPFDDTPATPEQRAFGADSRFVLRSEDGRVVLDRRGVRRGMPETWASVVPGRYVGRLEMPGGEVREEAADVAAGASVRLTFLAR